MKLKRHNDYSYWNTQKSSREDPGMLGILKLTFMVIGERGIEYLRPLTRSIQQINPRVRALALVTVSSFAVLILSLWVFGMLLDMGDANETTSQASGSEQDALAAPYDINQRQLPADGADPNAFLPPTIGDTYTLASNTAPIEETTRQVSRNAVGALHMCVLDFENSCAMQYAPQQYALGRYTDTNEQVIQVFVGNYWTTETAGITLTELITRSRSFGYVGNFVSGGVASVDYFYSNSDGWYSFTWSRGAWVISVSAKSREAVEAAVQSLSI